MNIFAWYERREADRKAAAALYAALVAQARQPVFYERLGVPDTTDGRFDMIAVHGFIVMRAAPGMTRRLRQCLFDAMFRDFERACREMGIGDLSVPRHVKRLMTAFKGRFFAYEQAGSDTEMMGHALRRNLYRKTQDIDTATINAVAGYVTRACARIAAQDAGTVRAGRLDFGMPEAGDEQRQRAA